MLEIKEKWTVKRKDGMGTRSRCIAVCGCGCDFEADYDNVRRGNTSRCQSCAKARKIEIGKSKRVHGLVGANKKDGGKIYYTWQAMRRRCNNPNDKRYDRYGGRGIKVCDRWDSFESFRLDMGEPPTGEHTIERIDYNKGYSPSNCRWATVKEQANNKSNNRQITAFGRTMNLAQWAEDTGIKREAIAARLRRGWSSEDAVSSTKNRSTIRTPLGEFATLGDAAKAHQCSVSGIHGRIKSSNFPGYLKL